MTRRVHDGDQHPHVALPEENALDISMCIARDKVLQLSVVVGQHYHRDVQSRSLDFVSEPRGIHVADFKVGNDEIESRLRAQQGQSFRTV